MSVLESISINIKCTFRFIFCSVRRPLDLSPDFPFQPFLVPAFILAISFLLSFELCLWVRILELTRFKWQLLQRTSPLVPLLHIKEFDILHAEHCGLWSSDIIVSFVWLLNVFWLKNRLWAKAYKVLDWRLTRKSTKSAVVRNVRHLEL